MRHRRCAFLYTVVANCGDSCILGERQRDEASTVNKIQSKQKLRLDRLCSTAGANGAALAPYILISLTQHLGVLEASKHDRNLVLLCQMIY